MEDNQLDFNRPLLSVRRHSAQPPPPPPRQQAAATRPPLPFYKSDLKSGPIRNPGIVPFVWEHTPGLPKDYRPRPPAAPNLPPSRIPSSAPPITEDVSDDDDGDNFTDAADTLSRTESFYMNCSVSGVSGFTEQRPFAADPQVRDFMMGRFLPAAQAAVTSPQRRDRKPGKAVEAEMEEGVSYRQHLPSPYRYGPNFVPPAEIIDEDDDYDDVPSRGCGLLPRFCLKSSFCLLNPVPGMKVRSSLRGRIASPQMRSSLGVGTVGEVEDESMWEEVYKHKLGHGVQRQGEEGSRVTSESNHLTYWSDSPTADGSSHQRSAGGVSPYRNEVGQNEGRCFLGVPVRESKVSGSSGSDACEKDSVKSSEIHSDGSRQGSGAIDRTLYVDCVQPPEVPHSKPSSIASNTETKGMVKPTEDDSELSIVSKTMEAGLDLESFGKDALQPKVSKLAGYMDGDNGFKHDDNHNGPQTLAAEYQVKTDLVFLQSLLPLPLPKSPTESWLGRTLPSVSSKNAPQQSFLGIQIHRKQALQAGSTNQKKEIIEKPVKVQRQIRFADMLKSEI